jgi:hypothetical protein
VTIADGTGDPPEVTVTANEEAPIDTEEGRVTARAAGGHFQIRMPGTPRRIVSK